jgi:hypothetical protein
MALLNDVDATPAVSGVGAIVSSGLMSGGVCASPGAVGGMFGLIDGPAGVD